jgi:hypothetical protein
MEFLRVPPVIEESKRFPFTRERDERRRDKTIMVNGGMLDHDQSLCGALAALMLSRWRPRGVLVWLQLVAMAAARGSSPSPPPKRLQYDVALPGSRIATASLEDLDAERSNWFSALRNIVGQHKLSDGAGCVADAACVLDALYLDSTEIGCGPDAECRSRRVAEHKLWRTRRGPAAHRDATMARLHVRHATGFPPSADLQLYIPVWNEIVLLPQVVHFWRSRVPGASITLMDDCNSGACSSDGTVVWAIAHNCSVIEWRMNPEIAWRTLDMVEAYREIRDEIWKGHQRAGRQHAARRGTAAQGESSAGCLEGAGGDQAVAWVAIPDLDEV